jgi:hypothetical protein
LDTLGYKQNNPGNIRNQGDVFDGEIYSGNAFKSFFTMGYGYRAMAILLFNYYTLYGDNTIRKLITRYAPPGENDTAGYIEFVRDHTGINPDKVLTTGDFKPGVLFEAPAKKIVRAISQKEISFVNERELTNGYNGFVKDKL